MESQSQARTLINEEGSQRMDDYRWMTGWWWVWPVLIVVGLSVLVYLGVLLSRDRLSGSRRGGADGGAGYSARGVLDERYARGEIDEEEYRRRKAELQ
ncbi:MULTISPECIES: SHOCT domain-containing protein [unclassified Amycolatopsis]|uniref:SHOCT domain-containing protein n=1 Tax=unclassified Amycolatopsis TaxID=2618356 RepID=UPI002106437F|nr:SHOCT domain-containing protein [Amycolatopsis sp. DSM 110486]